MNLHNILVHTYTFMRKSLYSKLSGQYSEIFLTRLKKVHDRELNISQSRLINVFKAFSRLFNCFLVVLLLSKRLIMTIFAFYSIFKNSILVKGTLKLFLGLLEQ